MMSLVAQASPEAGSAPGFDIAQSAFDTFEAVRLRSPLSTLPDGVTSRVLRNVHHDSSLRWLEINT